MSDSNARPEHEEQHYHDAGDGQCLGLKADGERCTNGVYGTDYCCGIHKRADDVTLAPEDDDRDWFYCDECGWQPADYEQGGGSPPYCSHCGIEFGGPLMKWGRDNRQPIPDGGVSAEVRADALEAQIAVSTDLSNCCEMMDLWEGEQCGDHAEVLAVLDSEFEDTPLNVWMCMSCLTQKSGSGVEIIDAPTNSRIRRSEDV